MRNLRSTEKRTSPRIQRILNSRLPKLNEAPKSALLVRGNQCNEEMLSILRDLSQMKAPFAKLMTRKHPDIVCPFEDSNRLLSMANSNQCSMFCLASHHPKKNRGNCLTFGRTFDAFNIVDMVECKVTPVSPDNDDTAFTSESKPCMCFIGNSSLNNFFLDFFRGRTDCDKINLSGIDRVCCLSASSSSVFHLRHYGVKFKKSGTKVPRVDLTLLKGSFDFTVNRQIVNADVMKAAIIKSVPKQRKNSNKWIEEGTGDIVGTIHVNQSKVHNFKKARALG